MTRRFKILRIVSGTIFSCIGLFLTLDNFLPINKSKYYIADKDLMTLTGYLINDPYYHKSSGGKGSSTYFKIELNAYPGVDFQNESVFLKATRWESIKAEVKYHDTVNIKVLKLDFERKYLNRDSMTVFQQIANYPFHKFEFYSFKFRDKEYVTDLYEAAKQHQQDNLFPQFIIGLAFVGMGIYSFVAKK